MRKNHCFIFKTPVLRIPITTNARVTIVSRPSPIFQALRLPKGSRQPRSHWWIHRQKDYAWRPGMAGCAGLSMATALYSALSYRAASLSLQNQYTLFDCLATSQLFLDNGWALSYSDQKGRCCRVRDSATIIVVILIIRIA